MCLILILLNDFHSPLEDLHDVQQIEATSYSFAALRSDFWSQVLLLSSWTTPEGGGPLNKELRFVVDTLCLLRICELNHGESSALEDT